MDRSQPNGLIGNPNNPTEAARYMYGHGFGLLFLASVYGEEEDGDRRQKLEKILTKASSSPARPRPIGAAGATCRQPTAATSTKGR